MRKTKLGPHHQLGGADTRPWAGVAAGLLCVGDFGAAAEAPADALKVGRVIDDGRLFGQGFDFNRHCLDEGASAADMATYFFEFVLRDAIAANPAITFWLGPNEQVFRWSREREEPLDKQGQPNPHYDPQAAARLQADRERVMRWYAEFGYRLAEKLFRVHRRLVFGNWSVGHPHPAWNLWPHYRPVLQACVDYGAVHASHAYGPRTEDSALRYRADYREFKRLGFPATPFMLTECGAEYEGGMEPWKLQYGGRARDYFEQWVRPFALAIEDDDYVMLAALFTSGTGAAPAWDAYDVTGAGLAQLMVDWCAGRDPRPEGEIDVKLEDLQAIAASNSVIEAEAAKIQARLAPYLAPRPWWESWPEGALTPARRLAEPAAAIPMRFADGTPNGIHRRNGMDAVERRGRLLKVWDVAGEANDWWVDAGDVRPG